VAFRALGDLAVDNLHYNAHTTGADAFWAGGTAPPDRTRLLPGALLTRHVGRRPQLKRAEDGHRSSLVPHRRSLVAHRRTLAPHCRSLVAHRRLPRAVPAVVLAARHLAGRASASFAHALGMSLMVAPGLRAYEDHVQELGSRQKLLWCFRRRLLHMRDHAPFFDLERLARDQERVARAMFEVHAAGHHYSQMSFRANVCAVPANSSAAGCGACAFRP
jgi:hypothetical protein